MPNQERKERAVNALTKYRGRITSEERIASFAARFVEQECAWKDVKKEPPTDTMLVLLKDSKTNIVRLGYPDGWRRLADSKSAEGICPAAVDEDSLGSQDRKLLSCTD
jgi:hypothetical protein